MARVAPVCVVFSAAILQFVLAGCVAVGPEFEEAPTITANPNPAVPQAAVVRFKAEYATHMVLEVSDGENDWSLEYDGGDDPEMGLPVVGMRPGREHTIKVGISDGMGFREAPEALRYTTPPLPDDPARFPPLEVTVNQADELEPGFVLFNPRRRRI